MANFQSIQEEIAKDEQPVPVPVFQKDGSPYLAADGVTQCTFLLLGSDAKKVQAARDSVQRRMIRTRTAKITPETIRRNRVEVAAAAFTGWTGWDAGDAEFPCTPTNVEAMLAAEHLLVQAEAGVDGHSDFFPSS